MLNSDLQNTLIITYSYNATAVVPSSITGSASGAGNGGATGATTGGGGGGYLPVSARIKEIRTRVLTGGGGGGTTAPGSGSSSGRSMIST